MRVAVLMCCNALRCVASRVVALLCFVLLNLAIVALHCFALLFDALHGCARVREWMRLRVCVYARARVCVRKRV